MRVDSFLKRRCRPQLLMTAVCALALAACDLAQLPASASQDAAACGEARCSAEATGAQPPTGPASTRDDLKPAAECSPCEPSEPLTGEPSETPADSSDAGQNSVANSTNPTATDAAADAGGEPAPAQTLSDAASSPRNDTGATDSGATELDTHSDDVTVEGETLSVEAGLGDSSAASPLDAALADAAAPAEPVTQHDDADAGATDSGTGGQLPPAGDDTGTPSPEPSSPDTTIPPFDRTLSAQFDGVDDYFEVFERERFNLGTADFTVSGWYRNAASQIHGAFFSKGFAGAGQSDGDTYPGYWLGLRNGLVSLVLDDGTQQHAVYVANAEADTWHHAVGVRAGAELRLYVDGELASTSTGVPPNFSVSTQDVPAIVGANYSFRPDGFFAGELDDVAVFRRALDDDDVAALFTQGPQSTDPSLLAHWSFDDGTTRDASSNDLGSVVSGAPEGFDGVPAPWVAEPQAGNSSARFDGQGDYLEVTPAASFEFEAADFTFAAWCNSSLPSPITGAFFSKAFAVGDYPGYYLGLSGAARVALRARDLSTSLELHVLAPAAGQWFHVAGVRRGQRLELYLNGRLASSAELPSGFQPETDAPVRIGASHSFMARDFFAGELDDVVVYQAALTSEQIRLLADQGPDLEAASLLGAWTFEAGLSNQSEQALDTTAQGDATRVASPR